MTEPTNRLALPLIEPGQAQKEMTHNEALARLDIAVQATAEAVLDTPPAEPLPGQCWIVGAAPTGAWSGEAGAIAGWTPGGWRFVAPREGMAAWLHASALPARYLTGEWRIGTLRAAELLVEGSKVIGARQSGVADPTGGTVVDVQARAALSALLAATRAHGLIAS